MEEKKKKKKVCFVLLPPESMFTDCVRKFMAFNDAADWDDEGIEDR